MKKQCAYCGEEFEPTSGKQKFCCESHKVMFSRKKAREPIKNDPLVTVFKQPLTLKEAYDLKSQLNALISDMEQKQGVVSKPEEAPVMAPQTATEPTFQPITQWSVLKTQFEAYSEEINEARTVDDFRAIAKSINEDSSLKTFERIRLKQHIGLESEKWGIIYND